MSDPVIYYRPGCPFALKLRTALTLHRMRFSSVRFGDDEAVDVQVRSVNGGNQISPTVHVNGTWLTNPNWREVAKASSS